MPASYTYAHKLKGHAILTKGPILQCFRVARCLSCNARLYNYDHGAEITLGGFTSGIASPFCAIAACRSAVISLSGHRIPLQIASADHPPNEVQRPYGVAGTNPLMKGKSYNPLT